MNVDKKEHCQDSFEQEETFQQPTQLLWYCSRIGKREPETELYRLPDWAPNTVGWLYLKKRVWNSLSLTLTNGSLTPSPPLLLLTLLLLLLLASISSFFFRQMWLPGYFTSDTAMITSEMILSRKCLTIGSRLAVSVCS